jgi:hypothetical protein
MPANGWNFQKNVPKNQNVSNKCERQELLIQRYKGLNILRQVKQGVPNLMTLQGQKMCAQPELGVWDRKHTTYGDSKHNPVEQRYNRITLMVHEKYHSFSVQ